MGLPREEGRIGLMRKRQKMFTLDDWNPTVRSLYITVLVALWLGATIANVALIAGYVVNFTGLVGISIFVSIMLVRAYKPSQPTPKRLTPARLG